MIRQKKNHQKNCWWCECLQHSLGYNSWEFQWSLREVDANLPSISRENGCSASLSSAGKSSSVMQESFSVRKAEVRRCSGTNLLCSAHVPTAPTAVPSQLWLSLQEPTSAPLLWTPRWFYPISTHQLTGCALGSLMAQPVLGATLCPPAQLCAATSTSLAVPGLQLGWVLLPWR